MLKTSIVYKSAVAYSVYYVNHRMDSLCGYVGWDLKTLAKLPFMIWVRRMEIDFLRPAIGGQEITITSFVREFRGPDAHIECSMIDESGKNIRRCLMIVAYVDKSTNRAMDWRIRWHCPLKKKRSELNRPITTTHTTIAFIK